MTLTIFTMEHHFSANFKPMESTSTSFLAQIYYESTIFLFLNYKSISIINHFLLKWVIKSINDDSYDYIWHALGFRVNIDPDRIVKFNSNQLIQIIGHHTNYILYFRGESLLVLKLTKVWQMWHTLCFMGQLLHVWP